MIVVHPDRWNPCRPDQQRKAGVVVHTSESSDTSYAGLIAAFQRPGDRPDGQGGVYGSSYHAITRGDGTYERILTDSQGPFAAPPCNYTWLHIVMPGTARQTRAEWLDPISRQHIRGVARFIVDNQPTHGYPLTRVTGPTLVQGAHGYCGHVDVSDGFGQTNHYDPGPAFPWDVLAADIADFARKGQDVSIVTYWKNQPNRLILWHPLGWRRLRNGEDVKIALLMGARDERNSGGLDPSIKRTPRRVRYVRLTG